MTRGEFAQPQHRIRVAVLAHIGKDRDRDIVFAERIKKLHGTHDLQPLDAARPASGNAAQFDLRQSELCARELAIVAGGMLRRRGVGLARLLGTARSLGGAALPVAGPRQRGRIDAADADAGEMPGGGVGVLQETQGDPAGGEFLFGLVDIAGGERGITRD